MANNLINKILITTAIICMFCPPLRFITSIIAAIAIITIATGQRKLDEKYPYDITAYIYHMANGNTSTALAEIQDFAHNCPYFDENTCLCEIHCPDCQYGRY